jgi:hypothetical protein
MHPAVSSEHDLIANHGLGAVWPADDHLVPQPHGSITSQAALHPGSLSHQKAAAATKVAHHCGTFDDQVPMSFEVSCDEGATADVEVAPDHQREVDIGV